MMYIVLQSVFEGGTVGIMTTFHNSKSLYFFVKVALEKVFLEIPLKKKVCTCIGVMYLEST